MSARSVIQFYSLKDAYGEFSNFAPFPVEIDGKTWPTSEHFFQAMKFLDTAHHEDIRRVKSPMIAARMGRSRKRPLRPDWGRSRTTLCGRLCGRSSLSTQA